MPFARLPSDQNGTPIQVLSPAAASTVALTAGAASVNAALPTNCEVIRVACINDCYVNFGTAGVTASGAHMLFTKGSELFDVPAGATHVAVIQHTTGGAVTVTPML